MEVITIQAESKYYPQALQLRYALFFQEHGLPFSMVTDKDEGKSTHLAIIENNVLLAYGRLTILDNNTSQLSQIVVQPGKKGQGYGTKILKELVALSKNKKISKLSLNARVTKTGLYEKMGFKPEGEIFPSKKTGIPHIQMILETGFNE